ncbi:MAG: PAS domain S-box protein [Proteobacteria bacterium]|nr:PAS domain S-box protein [Pseudomonadota bacterium]
MNIRHILLVFTFFIVMCGLLFTSFYEKAKQESIKNLNTEQLLYARQATRGIEDFFTSWTTTLTVLSETSHIKNMDKTGKDNIETLYKANSELIRAITRVDASGRIIYTFPYDRNAIGRDISSQKHVREIRHTHKPVISDVFSTVQGYSAIAVQVPVFKDKTYQGTIGINVNFQSMAKRYLEVIRIGKTGYAWVISRDGTELFCPIPGHVGNSVFENCKDFPSILAMAQDMLKRHEGATVYTFDKIRGETVDIVKKHAVYMPITIGNTFWSIVVASSEDEVLSSLDGFRNRLIIIIGFLLLGGVLFSHYGLKAWFIIREEEKRRRAEEALRESEAKFRKEQRFSQLLLDTSPALIVAIGFDGKTLMMNQALLDALEYTKEEVTGVDYLNTFVPEEDREMLALVFQQIINEGKATVNENRIKSKSGRTYLVEWYGRTVVRKEGDFDFFVGVGIDITGRKRAELELHIKDRAIASSFNAVVISDLNGNITYVNDAFLRMWGYTNQEALNINVADLDSDKDEIIHIIDAIKGKGFSLGESVAIRNDGSLFNIQYSASLVTGSSGEPIAMLSTFVDITEQKQAENVLRWKTALLEAQVNTSIDGILVVDENQRRIVINRRIADLWSVPQYILDDEDDAVLLKYVVGLVRHPEQFIEKVKHLYEHPYETSRDEIEFKSGMVLDRYSAPVLGEDGYHYGRIWTFHDITGRKQAEEERQKLRERLQNADKMEAIGTLAGGIAHDFNNLLMGIQGYASLTLLDLDPSHPHYERLKRIEEQVQSGADLTKQLLGFARGGKYEVKPADMNDILENTSSMFGRTKKEISIHRKYGKNLRTVEVDRGQMEQVFMNLYVNAWQAMPGGGEIYLETENVLLDDEQAIYYSVKPGQYIKISMTDTGTGMDEKTKERIFDPFFTTKEMGRGTGLGLATVYGIIKGHGGIINVYSKPGHGATFNIYLPVSEKEVVKERTATGTIKRGTETILMVDDENMVLEVSRALLESLGYRVYTAVSGKEAIAVYMEKRNEINMVLLDMIMPGISGGETFDRLKEINPDIKVVLSSGYSINDQAQEILDRGCNGFLQKPFRIEILSDKIREMLD